MATYDGFISETDQSDRPLNRLPLNDIGAGRSHLADDFAIDESGSYPSGNYPSGVAALGVPVIKVAPGGNAIFYVALDVGQSVSVPVYASSFGKSVIRIIDRIGPSLDAAYSADNDEWEYIVATLPSGYAKGIYLVEIANNAFQSDGDAHAYFGPIEVI